MFLPVIQYMWLVKNVENPVFYSIMQKLKPFLFMQGMGWGGSFILLQQGVIRAEEDGKFASNPLLYGGIVTLAGVVAALWIWANKREKEWKEERDKRAEADRKDRENNAEALRSLYKNTVETMMQKSEKERRENWEREESLKKEAKIREDEMRAMIKQNVEVISSNTASHAKMSLAIDNITAAFKERMMSH
jgi:hypothetical protein